MAKLKCLIIDDDPQITDLVVHFSEKSELIDYCVACIDPIEGIKLLSNSTFDVLFLDYNMPILNGQDILDVKRDKSKVIMITSNINFAVSSYKYDMVVDYLVKPLDYSLFETAVSRVCKKIIIEKELNTTGNKKSLMVKDGNNWIPIPFASILFIKSESNYCTFYTQDGKVMSLAKLKELEDKLPSQFIRCHRSYIINTTCITQINLEEISIKNEIIPISAMYKEAIKRFIQLNA